MMKLILNRPKGSCNVARVPQTSSLDPNLANQRQSEVKFKGSGQPEFILRECICDFFFPICLTLKTKVKE